MTGGEGGQGTPAPRFCFYVPLGQFNENGYIPSVVYEGEPGHSPLVGRDDLAEPWYWGKTYAEAHAVCHRANEQLGLSLDDITTIVASSIGAQLKGDSVKERGRERLRRLRVRTVGDDR